MQLIFQLTAYPENYSGAIYGDRFHDVDVSQVSHKGSCCGIFDSFQAFAVVDGTAVKSLPHMSFVLLPVSLGSDPESDIAGPRGKYMFFMDIATIPLH